MHHVRRGNCPKLRAVRPLWPKKNGACSDEMGKKKAQPDDARKDVQAHAEAIAQAKDERKEEAKRLL